MSETLADFENMMMSLENPIKSSVITRWERKQQNGTQLDRFIPNRSGMDKVLSNQTLIDDNQKTDEESNVAKALKSSTSDCDGNTRILAFKNKAPVPKDGYQSSLKVLYSQQTGKRAEFVKSSRHIPSAPFRILDAPEIVDDYYLNLLSWSSSNVLAVALSQSVYLWDAASGTIKELMTMGEPAAADGDSPSAEYVSSVAWVQQGGQHLAIGTSDPTCPVQLWDVQAGKLLRTMGGHSSRVGALAWNNHILTSGSRDTNILQHDVRVQNHVVGVIKQHTQEVCGLSWSPDGSYLASGANDNSLKIFEQSSVMGSNDATPLHVMTEHQAAVKALAWSPHERHLLASGGGTADRCIKFWNAASGSLINSVDTGSQVCALQWSPYEKELLSSHGFAENQLCLWKYPTMVKTKEFKGHTARVLHMAQSPDGSMVCSAAADETLRFWNIFGSEGKKKEIGGSGSIGGLSGKASTSLKLR